MLAWLVCCAAPQVLHLKWVHSLGITYAAHPDGFVVHMPHGPSSSWELKKLFPEAQPRLLATFVGAVKRMGNGTYAPVTSFPHLCT